MVRSVPHIGFKESGEIQQLELHDQFVLGQCGPGLLVRQEHNDIGLLADLHNWEGATLECRP